MKRRKRAVPTTTTTTAAPATTGSASTTTIPPTTTTPPTTAAGAPVNSVDWGSVSLPGSACYSSGPIRLQDFKATFPAPADLHAGTPDLLVEAGPVLYGDLFGSSQDVAAVNVMCSNTGGTADGELLSTWVIYDMDGSSPNAIGVLTPQQASAPGTHVPLLSGGLTITTDHIVVPERWYTASNATCCPSGQATTTWVYENGGLVPVSTVG